MNQENPTDTSTHHTPAGEGLSAASGSVFPISTLRDIFELPTYDAMERCLDELKTMMLQARATNDLMASMIEMQQGITPDNGRVFQWPDVCEWNDDGKGVIESNYMAPNGDVILTTKVSPNAQNQPPQSQTK
jgi:hypothetical protein